MVLHSTGEIYRIHTRGSTFRNWHIEDVVRRTGIIRLWRKRETLRALTCRLLHVRHPVWECFELFRVRYCPQRVLKVMRDGYLVRRFLSLGGGGNSMARRHANSHFSQGKFS